MYADATIKRGVNQFFVLRNIPQDISAKTIDNKKENNIIIIKLVQKENLL